MSKFSKVYFSILIFFSQAIVKPVSQTHHFQVKECDGNESYENVTLQLIELISTAFIKAIEEKHLKGTNS